MDKLLKGFESLLPYALAMLMPKQKDQDRVIAISEICEKHGVSFRQFLAISQELQSWEENYTDVRH